MITQPKIRFLRPLLFAAALAASGSCLAWHGGGWHGGGWNGGGWGWGGVGVGLGGLGLGWGGPGWYGGGWGAPIVVGAPGYVNYYGAPVCRTMRVCNYHRCWLRNYCR